MVKRVYKQSLGSRAFDIINYAMLAVLAFFCLYPFLNVLAYAFSSESAVLAGKVGMVPVQFRTAAMKRVLTNPRMVQSLLFTLKVTLLGTAINLVMTILAGYALSKKRLKGRVFLLGLIIFTMYFDGGMVPKYILIRELGMLNTIWALIIPGAISTFNMIIVKTYFSNLPEELEESAKIDGANDYLILIRIIVPVSLPIIATISLFYSVGHWNEFRKALLYITSTSKYTLQLILRQLIDQFGDADAQMEDEFLVKESVRSASIIIATVPILVVYPWLQKYFTKGVMLGSVKG